MAYQAKITEYRRLRAIRKYPEAMVALDEAIQACPVDEAIPVLESYKAEMITLCRPAWSLAHTFGRLRV